MLNKICTHDARLRLGQGRPGLQKVRHGLFIPVVCQDSAPNQISCSQLPFSNQHKRTLLPGRYVPKEAINYNYLT
jgi:hypothetical protein